MSETMTKTTPTAETKKRSLLPWLLFGITAFVLLLVLVANVAYVFYPTGPLGEETRVLRSLEEYEIKYELDERTRRVVRVMLEGKQVTDDALDDVPKLTQLKRLSLHKSSVTDAGLAKLTDMRRLENIGLSETLVTDDGLKHLEKIHSLKNIWLTESDKLTSEGIESLRKALPGVRVNVMNNGGKKGRDKKGKDMAKT